MKTLGFGGYMGTWDFVTGYSGTRVRQYVVQSSTVYIFPLLLTLETTVHCLPLALGGGNNF